MKSYEEYIQEIDLQVQDIIKRAQAYITSLEQDQISEDIELAYEFAKSAHKGVVRLSGEPYIAHPVAATEILLSLAPDIATIQACFLHDVIEDTDYTFEDIKEAFGEDVAVLCAGMEKLEKVKYRGEDRAIGSLRKMFLAMAEDLRVVFIKLSDRLHNMQTLHHHPNATKRERIAQETLNIYAPIAGRLGLYKFKNDLEEECFKILHPESYEDLQQKLKELESARDEFKNSAIVEMQKTLLAIDMPHRVDFRIKSSYSIYKKLLKKGLDHPGDLYDIYGVRIIVGSIADCYRVLGEIHSTWHTLPYRFKDYIALPKPNGYQSLHTTIIGFLKKYRKQPTEIQIRTEDMHTRAELGVAAHFEYKEKGSKIAEEINWVNELKESLESVGNNDLMSSLRIDTFKDRIFVFTPKGDLINLPQGSTPVDFAYQVHSDLGNHISIAKVNGVVHPLDKDLKNGDIIDIVTDKNRKPSPFWLSFVKTMRAKGAIKSYLRRGNKETHRDRGREILNKYLEKSGLPVLDKDMVVLKVLDDRVLGTEDRLQILEQIGNFSINPSSVLRKILREKNIITPSSRKKIDKNLVGNISGDKKIQEIVIGGEEGIPFKKCKICSKKGLSDQIVAHINSRGQFTVHARDCPILKGVNKERLMNAYVKGDESISIFQLSLTLKNKVGMMKIVSETLYQMEINIDEIHTKKISPTETILTVGLEIPDYDYLLVDRFVERLKSHLGDSLVDIRVTQVGV
ncbi:RelA/SpoT family protein [Candidatus Gracilibacteria bacterium]|nr:RelA/SpoT family protein [Candidatus Gracilibacteria bacterium]